MFAQFFRRHVYVLYSQAGEHLDLKAIVGDGVVDGEDIPVEDHHASGVQLRGDHLFILQFEFGVGVEQ